MDVKTAAGQHIMAGLPGTEIDPAFAALVRECKVGNVILFRRNVKNAAQLARLCASLRELIVSETGMEPFIAIDQEGGVVSRFSPDMATTPGAMALAAAGGDAPYRAARLTAAQLRAAGVNFDLAPVLDVNSNPLNPVIGVRSFGDLPEEAAERAMGFMRGLLDGGVIACGKHFPGHGDTDTDSHIGLPRVDKSREQLEECELLPFRRAIEAGIPAIMSSHVLFPALEPEKLPATMSRRILTGLLREELGFGGVIISDCMEMDAVAKFYGTVNGAAAALKAGADIVCISHTAALARETAERLWQRYEAAEGEERRELERSGERIAEAKRRFTAVPKAETQIFKLRAQARDMLEESFVLMNGPIPPLGDSPFFTGCANSRTSQASSAANGVPALPTVMARRFGGGCAVCSDDPDSEEIAAIARKARNASCIVLNPSGGNAATELTVWLPVYQFGDGISDEDFWNEKFDAFEAENNCTIKVEIQGWTDYATNIYTGLLSAEGPDVVYVTEYYDIITSELIVPLDAYLTEEDYDLYLYLTQGAYNSNGELCTFPMMPGNPCVMYFNMDMLEAAGVTELPTTWDEFYEVCLKLKEANPDVMPFTSSWGASNGVSALLTSFWPFFFQAGGSVLTETGELNMDSEATLEALNFIKKLRDADILDESAVSMDDPGGKFVNGEAAIVIVGTGTSGSFTEAGINWECIFALEGPAGAATNFSVDSLAISKFCENPELAAKLIKYITSAACMDDFHNEIYGMPSLTTDATYTEPEPFQSMYVDHADDMFAVPSFEGSASFMDTFQQNVQGMLMGQLTPEQVISETMTYYNEQIKQ